MSMNSILKGDLLRNLLSIWESSFLGYLPDKPEAAGRELRALEDASVAGGEGVG